MKKVTIVIPAYNEEKFVGLLLDKINEVDLNPLGIKKEIIVIDDCSTDRTAEVVTSKLSEIENLIFIKQPKNQGKGSAVKMGISKASGDWVLVQDADLEYDPQDYIPMLKVAIDTNFSAVAVYGSRTMGQVKYAPGTFFSSKGKEQKFANWLAGRLLSVYTLVIYGLWITDTLTAYKLYPTKLLQNYEIRTRGFETDHELTALLFHNEVKILEVPIKYFPRSVEEGKKIKTRDFFVALWTLMRFRFA